MMCREEGGQIEEGSRRERESTVSGEIVAIHVLYL